MYPAVYTRVTETHQKELEWDLHQKYNGITKWLGTGKETKWNQRRKKMKSSVDNVHKQSGNF